MSYGMSRPWLLSLALFGLALAACAPEKSEPAPEPPPTSAAKPGKPGTRGARAVDLGRAVSIEGGDFRALFSPQNAALARFVFKDDRYERNGKPIDLVTTDKLDYLPLSLQIEGADLPQEADWKVERISEQAARFTLETDQLTLVRKVEAGEGPYQLWSTLRVVNRGSAPKSLRVKHRGYHYVRRGDEQGGFLAGRSALSASGMCVQGDSAKRFDREEIVEEHPSLSGNISFGSLDNLYFTQAIAADGKPFESCQLSGSDRGGTGDSPDGSLLEVTLAHEKVSLAPQAEATFRTLAYFGPKTPKELAAAGHHLDNASYTGGLPGVDSIARSLVGLLAYIHDHVIGNWGLAIILLTVFVKAVLFPLTAKSFQSIAAMRQLKPAIDQINERYADDREKKGAAMMELYKKHKINPFGGCLPQLLQLPVWWALYTSLSTNVELFKRPFFGFWQDLSAPDPYYVLPLALGVLMWVQQKITPSTMDPAQAKMMLYVMPAMITSFMLFLPAGLCLYMFTNSVLSIGQQRFIEYRLSHKQAAVAAAANVGGSADSPTSAAKDAGSPRRTGRGRA